jgi:hypothetical protein
MEHLRNVSLLEAVASNARSLTLPQIHNDAIQWSMFAQRHIAEISTSRIINKRAPCSPNPEDAKMLWSNCPHPTPSGKCSPYTPFPLRPCTPFPSDKNPTHNSSQLGSNSVEFMHWRYLRFVQRYVPPRHRKKSPFTPPCMRMLSFVIITRCLVRSFVRSPVCSIVHSSRPFCAHALIVFPVPLQPSLVHACYRFLPHARTDERRDRRSRVLLRRDRLGGLLYTGVLNSLKLR